MTPYPVPELLRAVRAEIRAMLHGDMRQAVKVSLHEGREVGRSGDEREYLFSCKKWNDGFAVKDLVIRRNRTTESWARARVHRMPNGKVKVVTNAGLCAPPVSAQLAQDDTGGLEALAERLEKAGGTDSPVNLPAQGWRWRSPPGRRPGGLHGTAHRP